MGVLVAPYFIGAIYPGSFYPVHCGQWTSTRRALRMFDRVVVAIYVHPRQAGLFTAERAGSGARWSLIDEPRVRVASYII